MKNIRNFSIIAHIDHGKSTLADRMLEITKTIPERKMRDQVLDRMDLERERGITIKMKPARMNYALDGEEYILNLIDTPGHIDFSYEVSRALKAVEGSLLLIDATQGVQAQTLTTLSMAREQGLVLIPVLSKIDSPYARVSEIKDEICRMLGCEESEIIETSGKTGYGIEALLEEIIKKIPPPSKNGGNDLESLVFDFEYSNHRGVIVYVRVIEGSAKKGDYLKFKVSKHNFIAGEVGIFAPEDVATDTISAGEIGYIVTGIKTPGIASVGDTVSSAKSSTPPLFGYESPAPVVWASIYPESQDDFPLLKQGLDRLKLTDSSLSYEEESSGTLGRGYRCGFLGMLHLEIISERLRREHNLEIIVTAPSITYEILTKNGKREIIYSPLFFPEEAIIDKVFEPWVNAKIISPARFTSPLMQLFFEHEVEIKETYNMGDDRTLIKITMPLRELMRNFFDQLKSATSGYGSISYEIAEMREASVCRMDILVADEMVAAFSRVIGKKYLQDEAESSVEKLFNILPRQMFVTKIQARAYGRIVSSRTLTALKKDVTGYLYGGDITRKMKLREKQKKGKKKMKARGRVNIPHSVFLKMMRS